MLILVQFLFRLAFGLAFGMAATSPREVSAGYFRVHLYVVLGLNTVAALAALAVPQFSLWPPVLGALLSYVGAVCWLYEAARPGRVLLAAVSITALWGAWQTLPATHDATGAQWVLALLDPVVGGLLLGVTMAAMLLGHWYLNTPGMQLAPLRRLLMMMAVAVVVRSILCGVGLWLQATTVGGLSIQQWEFWTLRWLSGLIGVMLLVWMAWQTLKVPNTQSATGILYVAVIGTFLGELTGQLLSGELLFPV